MNATPHPFPGLVTEAATDLSAEEALTDLGWEILAHVPGEVGGDTVRHEPRFTVLHPDFGIALLDIAPEATPDAAAALRRRLDAAGAPPGLPVIQHSLTGDDLWRLTSVLDRHFASLPPLPSQAGDWPALVRQVLAEGTAGTDPAPAPAPAPAPDPAPVPARVLVSAREEPELDDWPSLPARLEDLRPRRMPPAPPPVPAEVPPGPAAAPQAVSVPPARSLRPEQPSSVPAAAQRPPAARQAPPARSVASVEAAPARPSPAPLPRAEPPFPQAARLAEATGYADTRPQEEEQGLAAPAGAVPGIPPVPATPAVRSLPVVTPRPPVSADHSTRRRSRKRRLAMAALGSLLLVGGVATALIGHLPGQGPAPHVSGERIQEAAIVPLPSAAPQPAASEPVPQADETEVVLPPPLPSPPAARPATQRSPAFRGEPLVPTPGPQPEAQRLPAPLARRVVVHHAPGLWDGVEGVVDQISRFGVPVERRVVGASTSRKIVRFFTQADQHDAEQLARSLGRDWMVQDFTSFTPRPRPGTLEVWLPAGAG